ncbi:addiction module protein [Candidatus Thiosymbion oneisti]|uniref:addiction module protein n=1 Tax=Candidatus Thiosymbion oneisti TaxID=589554 RepID=UPI000B7E30E6|nr:addiction module protein [Candidatus Thiosymbion oneisti]
MDNNLLDSALKMPPNERVAFAELILASIDHEEEETRNCWVLEVRKRIEEVNRGKAKLLDFEKLYVEG